MQVLCRFIAIFASAILVGCSSYPPEGTGGLAEQYTSESFSPVMPDEPLGPEHGLRFDWQLAKLHLDVLIQEGAKWCFPAAVVQAVEKQNRIARELDAGLLLDAANDLIIQRKRLNQLELQLDYVTSQTRCTPPQSDSDIEMQIAIIETLYNLLNTDNQFTVNSAEVNPKFMGNLSKSASLLRKHPQLKLAVTGHADKNGSDDFNQKLAMDRAKQVKRYLIIFGLEPNRIETHSLGESLPLFEGETPATYLTNRRVSVEIISPVKQSQPHTSGGYYDLD